MAESVPAPKKAPAKLFNSKIDADAYNHVATLAKLVGIQMVSSKFDVTPTFFAKNDKVKLDLCHDILSAEFFEKDRNVAGIFRYEIVGKVSRKHVLTVRSDYMALYEVPEDSAENESKAFCARVGLFAAYTYFRALVSHYCSDGNLDLPVLPVLSADPLRKKTGKHTADLADFHKNGG